MPELPEVETIRRSLEETLVGSTIVHAENRRSNLRFPFEEGFSQKLLTRTLDSVSRQGKYIFFNFRDSTPSLLVHLGMSGKFRITSAHENPLLPHTHVVMVFDNGSILYYIDPRRFGFMRFMKEKDEKLDALGPEPFAPDLDDVLFLSLIHKRESSIKTVLLDQSIIAGLGNIYVLEALFQSQISPFRRAKDVTGEEASRLLKEVRCVLREAIEKGGSTLKDYQGVYGDGGYFQHQFKVYGRDKKACLRCEKYMICHQKQSGRSSYFCNHCQR